MTRHLLLAAGMIALTGCATGNQQLATPAATTLEPGATYHVEVENASACPAIVRFGETRLDRGQWLGTIPPNARDSFVLKPSRPGRVTAIALEEDGHMCDGRLDNPVKMSITREGAAAE